MSNQPPEILVGLTREQAQFLEENCTANISMALGLMQGLQPDQRDLAVKLVHMNEQFKAIREAVKKGLTDE